MFFDNTWDYNNDGLVKTPTHVGIVERQEQDGTVIFISRVAGAIERYQMNLALPMFIAPQRAGSSTTISAGKTSAIPPIPPI